jgi:hypothetical protein
MEEQTGVVDSPQQTELNLADVSTDDLRVALSTQEPEGAAEALVQSEEQSQGTQPETVTEEGSLDDTEVPEGAQTEPLSDTEVETEEERLAKRRIRPKNELDQQVIDLYRSEGFSGTFADASTVIYGQTAQPNQPPPQPAQQAEPQPDPFTQEAGALNAEIQQLEVKVKEAAEDLDTLQALNLQREIMRRELKLQSLHDRNEREQEKQQEMQYNTHRDKAVESRDRAYGSYPDLADKEGLYRKEFDHFIAQAQQSSDYAAVFQSPRWPEIMAHDYAAQKGYSPPQPQEAQPQVEQKQVRPTMGNQAKVLTTGQTAQPVQQPLTRESVLNSMGTMSNDQLYDLLGQPDGRTFLT